MVRSAASRADLERGVVLLTLAISSRPSTSHFYSVRGNAYRALGQYQRAFFDYSAALRYADHASNSLLFCNRSITLRKLGLLKEALGT